MKNQKIKFFFSVITVTFLLTACGIPNYFYLGSSYYSIRALQSTEEATSKQISTINITFSDIDQIAKCEDCPSAVIFYWIDRSPISNTNVSSGLSSAFFSAFKKSDNPSGGVPLTIYPDAQIAPVVEYQYEITASSGSDEKVKIPHTLYYATLLDGGGNNFPISSPTFHVSPEPGASAGDVALNFEIVMDDLETNSDGTPNPNYKHIYLYQKRGTPDESRFELRRYNSASFSTIPQSKDDIRSGNYSDYSVFTTDESQFDYQEEQVYVHFAIAFCAAKGSFNNVYWSSLNAGSGVTSLTFKIGRSTQPKENTP